MVPQYHHHVISILHFFPGAIPEIPTSLVATPATPTSLATLTEQGPLTIQALQDELTNLRVDHTSQLAYLRKQGMWTALSREDEQPGSSDEVNLVMSSEEYETVTKAFGGSDAQVGPPWDLVRDALDLE